MNALTEFKSFPIFAMERQRAIGVLKTSLYPGAKDESVEMVLSYCEAAGLDPLDKPVHIVPMEVSTGKKDSDGWDIKERRDVIMQGVGLYRTKAARTGQYGGQDEPIYGPDKTETLDGVPITYPEWCKVTVYRFIGSQRVGYTALERWKENYATKSSKSAAPNAMWKKRPYGQLSKCAEAQALRKGFPDAVGAAETADEMAGKSYDFDLDASGEVRPTVTMPQRRSAAEPPQTATSPDLARTEPAKEKTQAQAAAPAATAATGTINAGQVKYLGQKVDALELSDEALGMLLQRHGAAKLDTSITVEQFDAIKSELLGML